jgi:predicted sulfurtransferase
MRYTKLSQILRITGLMVLILTLALMVSCILSQDLKRLSAEELKKMIDEGPKMLIVDTRGEYEYRQGHIPGAINIPQEQFDNIEALMPKDKDMQIVFYCRGFG